MHAVVARSTFRSQKCKKLWGTERFQGAELELRAYIDTPLGGYAPEKWFRWIQQCRDGIYQDSSDSPAWDEKVTEELGTQAILDIAELTRHGFTRNCPVDGPSSATST